MIDLNLLKTFTKVAELGSFTKAAEYLKQPKSRVSRAISRLELELNTQLIRRTTRQTGLTEAGHELFLKTNGLLSQLNIEIDTVSNETHELSGLLKISAPEDFSQLVLPSLIMEFSEIHPHVKFEIISSNDHLDLTVHGIDLAFRIGTLKDSTLIQKKIGKISTILAAAPAYISKFGSPKQPTDLKDHKILSFTNQRNQDLLTPLYEEFSKGGRFRPFFVCNSFPMLHKYACAGKGIAILPDFISKSAMGEGRLVQVLPNWNASTVDIQIVYLPTKNMQKKVRAFIDFAVEKTSYLK